MSNNTGTWKPHVWLAEKYWLRKIEVQNATIILNVLKITDCLKIATLNIYKAFRKLSIGLAEEFWKIAKSNKLKREETLLQPKRYIGYSPQLSQERWPGREIFPSYSIWAYQDRFLSRNIPVRHSRLVNKYLWYNFIMKIITRHVNLSSKIKKNNCSIFNVENFITYKLTKLQTIMSLRQTTTQMAKRKSQNKTL